MWTKDLIQEMLSLLRELPEKIGEVVQRAPVSSGGHGSSSRGRSRNGGYKPGDLSQLSRDMEDLLSNLGRIIPGLGNLASTLRNLRSAVESINKFCGIGGESGSRTTVRQFGSYGQPFAGHTESRRRWTKTVLEAEDLSKEATEGFRSREAWLKTLLAAKVFDHGLSRIMFSRPLKSGGTGGARSAKTSAASADAESAATADGRRWKRGELYPEGDPRNSPTKPTADGRRWKRGELYPEGDPRNSPTKPTAKMAVDAVTDLGKEFLTAFYGGKKLRPDFGKDVAYSAAASSGRRLLPFYQALSSWSRVSGDLVGGPGAGWERTIQDAQLIGQLAIRSNTLPAIANKMLPAVRGPGRGWKGTTQDADFWNASKGWKGTTQDASYAVKTGTFASTAAGASFRIAPLLGPIGVAVAAIVAAGAAMVVLPPAIAKVAETALNSQRRLASVDTRMAGLFAGYDVRTILRDQQTAKRTFGTTQYLARATADLQDSLVPQKSFFTKLKNTYLSSATGIGQGIADITKPFFDTDNQSTWDKLQSAGYRGGRVLVGALSRLNLGAVLSGQWNPSEIKKWVGEANQDPKALQPETPWADWMVEIREQYFREPIRKAVPVP